MPNIEPLDNAQQPISDDQELAKVLAGVDLQTDAVAQEPVVSTIPPVQSIVEPVTAPVVDTPMVASIPVLSEADGLLNVKQEALSQLRPLVDKLNIPADEKFDTYLLLLRSTDDKSLIEPAYDTAKLIEDESRRAQALLDIIKEIDFLSSAK